MLIVGQVLWLRTVLNVRGTVSSGEHPYLIYKIDEVNRFIEAIQLDSMEGKERNFRWQSNYPIPIDGPTETVISKSSYARLNCTYTFELFDELELALKTRDTLSANKLKYLIDEYNWWHTVNAHRLNTDNAVHHTKDVLQSLNPKLLS